MRKLCYVISALGLIIAVSSCMDNRRAKNYNDKTLADDEGLSFIKNGIEGGRTEIKASELAKKNSTNPRVISFADMMITDHTAATNELKNIQSAKLVDVAPGITSEHQVKIDSLAAKTGVAFDKAYMTMMVADHESAEKLFAEATNNTSNMIQDFSRKLLPKIQMHLDSAKAILAGLK